MVQYISVRAPAFLALMLEFLEFASLLVFGIFYFRFCTARSFVHLILSFVEFYCVAIVMRIPTGSLAFLLYSLPTISASLLHPFSSRAISPDNTCGRNGTGGGADGYTCPADLPCCSVNGFCGSTNAYCLTTAGCQSDFGNCTAPSAGTITPDETCGMTGAGINGYTCGSVSPCCSGKYVTEFANSRLLPR